TYKHTNKARKTSLRNLDVVVNTNLAGILKDNGDILEIKATFALQSDFMLSGIITKSLKTLRCTYNIRLSQQL
ncbi:hypothetical protein BGZ49_006722, partial [Haplosporangium sp. Z 27]